MAKKDIKPNTDTPCFTANYHNGLSDAEAIRQLQAMGIKWNN